MELFLQQVLTGLATGSVYGLVALAIVLIYRSTDVINFAQGQMAMFTTFFAWMLFDGKFLGFHPHALHYWMAFGLTLVFALILGAVLERVVIRPVEGRPDPHHCHRHAGAVLHLRRPGHLELGRHTEGLPASP